MGKKEWKAMKKKRTFSNMITGFFNDDSKFMTFIGRVALLASANVCWLVCSLPAVTGGAALIALYTVLLERKEQTYDTAFKRFFQVFAKTLLPSLPLWLLTLGVGTALATAWRIVLRENLADHFFLLAPLLLASAVMAIALLWPFPLLASGETSWREALPAAFLLGPRELGRSLLLLLLEGAGVLLAACCFTASLTLTGIWLLFGFAVIAWGKLLIMEGVLEKWSNH